MLKIIIGNKAYSSWSLRGWLAVRQSGLPYTEVLVPIYDERWEIRKHEPDLAVSNGKVPTLWDGDIPVWDSLAIIEWLDERSEGTKFWPSDLAARALARSMASEMHSSYQALRKACCMNVRHHFTGDTPSPAVLADVARITSLWEQARNRFGSGGDFLFGDFGATDIMFAPVVTRFVTYGLPASPIAQAYINAVMNHPWMQQWITEAHCESWVLEQYEQGPNYEG